MFEKTPLLFVLSGPSGVGKDSVLARLKETEPNIRYITTFTTRVKRPSEIDGIDYHFITLDRFLIMQKKAELLESAKVYGHWYGVSKDSIREALKGHKDIIVKPDVQGAITYKKLIPEAVSIFLLPPSLGELKNRLKRRYTETPVELALRLTAAANEIKQVKIFDYAVHNNGDNLDEAVTDIKAIIRAERCKVKSRRVKLSE